MNRWITGYENDGMFWIVCEACAKESEAPYSHEDFYGELNADQYPNCENCKTTFEKGN